MKPSLLFTAAFALIAALPVVAQEKADAKAARKDEAAKAESGDKPEASARGGKGEGKGEDKIPDGKVWTSHHQITINGRSLAYTATVGTLQMKNEKDEPIALFGFTAYTRDGGDPRTRPLMFAYNGGPGSASAWLHMGILGPKRTVLADLAHNTRGPFRTVDNEFTVLESADLVMIDPVGTGFSRPIGKAEGKDFWGVDQDIESVSNFILRYLNQYNRWSSPKYILGESYGGMRTAGVSYHLFTRHNVALNGVVLVSPYLDYQINRPGLRLDPSQFTFLPSYAAVAWFHQALPNRPAELKPFLSEVEKFTLDQYAPALLRGAALGAEERKSVIAGLARYTGISADYWDKSDLRMSESRFAQELLRDRGLTTGRIDGRFLGGTLNPLAEQFGYDPYGASVGPAIVATFNDYVRGELKVDTDRSYVMSGGFNRDWDQRHAQPDLPGNQKSPSPNTVVDLSQVMTQNPNMKVLVFAGYFDLAVPYSATRYAIDHLDIDPSLRKNVQLEMFEAGHMMYVHPGSQQRWKKLLADFVQ